MDDRSFVYNTPPALDSSDCSSSSLHYSKSNSSSVFEKSFCWETPGKRSIDDNNNNYDDSSVSSFEYKTPKKNTRRCDEELHTQYFSENTLKNSISQEEEDSLVLALSMTPKKSSISTSSSDDSSIEDMFEQTPDKIRSLFLSTSPIQEQQEEEDVLSIGIESLVLSPDVLTQHKKKKSLSPNKTLPTRPNECKSPPSDENSDGSISAVFLNESDNVQSLFLDSSHEDSSVKKISPEKYARSNQRNDYDSVLSSSSIDEISKDSLIENSCKKRLQKYKQKPLELEERSQDETWVPLVEPKLQLNSSQLEVLKLMHENEQSSGGGIWQEMNSVKEEDDISQKVYCFLALILHSKTDASLIITSASRLSCWEDEILKHNSSLRVVCHHAKHRVIKNESEFNNFDIVITTYDMLKRKDKSVASTNKSTGGWLRATKTLDSKINLVSVVHCHKEWKRIILDETQLIANPKTARSQRAYELDGIYKWCILKLNQAKANTITQSLFRTDSCNNIEFTYQPTFQKVKDHVLQFLNKEEERFYNHLSDNEDKFLACNSPLLVMIPHVNRESEWLQSYQELLKTPLRSQHTSKLSALCNELDCSTNIKKALIVSRSLEFLDLIESSLCTVGISSCCRIAIGGSSSKKSQNRVLCQFKSRSYFKVCLVQSGDDSRLEPFGTTDFDNELVSAASDVFLMEPTIRYNLKEHSSVTLHRFMLKNTIEEGLLSSS